MSERLTLHPEKSSQELSKAAGERLEVLRKNESKAEAKTDNSAETAEIIREKIETVYHKEKPAIAEHKTDKVPASITNQGRKMVYKKTIRQMQTDMNPIQRTFSRFIHLPAIEKTSDVVGSTVARPNAILTGSITAFVAVLILYWLAKRYGYELSGFETIGTFLIGWLIGLMYDFFRTMITGKR